MNPESRSRLRHSGGTRPDTASSGGGGSALARLPRLRDYQQAAVDSLCAELAAGGSAQLHMACGTGKTLVELRVAEQVCSEDALVVVVVPTIALVDQLLSAWRHDSLHPFSALAVCSDDTAVDAPVHLADLSIAVTTDPDSIAEWVRATSGRRYLVSTYRSAHQIGAALRQIGATADLLICDEAHHLTGSLETPTRAILDRDWPTQRLLFATATPRVDLRRLPSRDLDVGSMDDTDLFGAVAYTYPFSAAIRDGWLKDYRLALIVVSDAEARTLLSETAVDYIGDINDLPLAATAAQIALLRAHVRFGIRRAVTFHRRIADAQLFSATLPRTAHRLGQDLYGTASRHAGQDTDRTADSPRPDISVNAGHLNGHMDSTQRRIVLDKLRSDHFEAGLSVISNVRCLAEGVDTPGVDAVLFAHPKRSPVDIVQALGRALRRTPGSRPEHSETATVIVPIVLNSTDTSADARAGTGTRDGGPGAEGAGPVIDPGAYSVLWAVVGALRAHDEELGVALDTRRAQLGAGESVELPEKISVVLAPGTADHVLGQITVELVEQTTGLWWQCLGEARRFHAAHGHLRVPKDYVSASGFALGVWISNQRTLYGTNGVRMRGERKDALDAIGMIWHVYDALWDEYFELVRAYIAEHGDLPMPRDHTIDGHNVAVWLRNQRSRLRRGTLRADRAARLEQLGIVRDGSFIRGLAASDRYRLAHGHLDVPDKYVDDTGFRLGNWIIRQRGRARGRKTGTPLTAEQTHALDSRGMIWSKQGARDLTDSEKEMLRAERKKGRRNPELTHLIARLVDDHARTAQIAEILGVTPGAVWQRAKKPSTP